LVAAHAEEDLAAEAALAAVALEVITIIVALAAVGITVRIITEAAEDALAVCGGKIKSIAVKPQRDGVIFAKRGEQVKVDTQVCLNEIVKAPIRQGEVVGEIRLFREGVEFDKIPVVACENVERANYWDSVMDVARDWSFAGK
jgi:hypothetical protein